jgi:hypothetical protein
MHIGMNSECNIQTLGDIHRTRWIGMTVYTLKMNLLLQGNEALIQVTGCEQQELQRFKRFIVRV